MNYFKESISVEPLAKRKKFPKDAVAARVDSLETAMLWACHYLGVMRHLAKQPAIVLDIDGTVLLNQKNGSAKCVTSFRKLCDSCAKCNITVFFVTAREENEENRAWTCRQLNKCCGFEAENDERLYMKLPSDPYCMSKEAAREDIRKKGYSILLTFGDQWCDHVSANITTTKDYIIGCMHSSAFVKIPPE